MTCDSKVPNTVTVQALTTFAEGKESAILRLHNDLRNQVQPTAKKMRKITWNKELSDVATNYSRKCIYEHNKVISIYSPASNRETRVETLRCRRGDTRDSVKSEKIFTL